MIEVGEYIRTKNGSIGKVNKIEPMSTDENYYVILNNKGEIDVLEQGVKAHSKNIIDLIEVGDIVQIKTLVGSFGLSAYYHVFDINAKNILIENTNNKEIEIISILTHEQYEQNCYKVGDIE